MALGVEPRDQVKLRGVPSSAIDPQRSSPGEIGRMPALFGLGPQSRRCSYRLPAGESNDPSTIDHAPVHLSELRR
jgi:hypothetical protein